MAKLYQRNGIWYTEIPMDGGRLRITTGTRDVAKAKEILDKRLFGGDGRDAALEAYATLKHYLKTTGAQEILRRRSRASRKRLSALYGSPVVPFEILRMYRLVKRFEFMVATGRNPVSPYDLYDVVERHEQLS